MTVIAKLGGRMKFEIIISSFLSAAKIQQRLLKHKAVIDVIFVVNIIHFYLMHYISHIIKMSCN